MKKLISLVLALVMALSLTTVAWGADVDDYTEFKAAIGGEITLTGDIVMPSDEVITVTGDTVINLNGFDLDFSVNTSRPFEMADGASLTINATGSTVKVGDYGLVKIPADNDAAVILNGGTYTGNTDKGSFVKPLGSGVISIELNGVNYTDSSAKNWLIDGTSYTGSDLTITVIGGSYNVYTGITAHYADITVSGAAFTVKHCGIESGLGSTALVENSTITASGTGGTGSEGPAAALAASNGGTMTVKGGTYTGSSNTTTDGKNAAAIYPSGGSITVESGTLDGDVKLMNSDSTKDYEVSISGGTVTGEIEKTASEAVDVTVSGGTFTTADVSDYLADGYVQGGDGSVVTPVAQVGSTKYATVAEAIAAANGADVVLLDTSATIPANYQTLKLTNGTVVVVPTVTRGDKFDLYLADAGMNAALKVKTPDVAGLSFTQVAAVSNSDGSGNLAYIAANNGEYYVKTTNPTVADYAVTVAGKTDVLYYVSVVDVADVTYGATAKAFTNFGTKCGQLYKVDTTKEYYVIEKAETGFALTKDDVSYVVLTGGVNVLVGNEIKTVAATAVDEVTTLAIDKILAHKWAVTGLKATVTGTTEPTQVTCLNCGAVVNTLYKSYTLVPAGNKYIDVPGYTNSWVFVEPTATNVGAPDVVTPSTDKVESAETFDAGIAMYVGMSIMAATGAVVLKKRED